MDISFDEEKESFEMASEAFVRMFEGQQTKSKVKQVFKDVVWDVSRGCEIDDCPERSGTGKKAYTVSGPDAVAVADRLAKWAEKCYEIFESTTPTRLKRYGRYQRWQIDDEVNDTIRAYRHAFPVERGQPEAESQEMKESMLKKVQSMLKKEQFMLKKGQRVSALFSRKEGMWKPGVIDKVTANGTKYKVLFDPIDGIPASRLRLRRNADEIRDEMTALKVDVTSTGYQGPPSPKKLPSPKKVKKVRFSLPKEKPSAIAPPKELPQRTKRSKRSRRGPSEEGPASPKVEFCEERICEEQGPASPALKIETTPAPSVSWRPSRLRGSKETQTETTAKPSGDAPKLTFKKRQIARRRAEQLSMRPRLQGKSNGWSKATGRKLGDASPQAKTSSVDGSRYADKISKGWVPKCLQSDDKVPQFTGHESMCFACPEEGYDDDFVKSGEYSKMFSDEEWEDYIHWMHSQLPRYCTSLKDAKQIFKEQGGDFFEFISHERGPQDVKETPEEIEEREHVPITSVDGKYGLMEACYTGHKGLTVTLRKSGGKDVRGTIVECPKAETSFGFDSGNGRAGSWRRGSQGTSSGVIPINNDMLDGRLTLKMIRSFNVRYNFLRGCGKDFKHTYRNEKCRDCQAMTYRFTGTICDWMAQKKARSRASFDENATLETMQVRQKPVLKQNSASDKSKVKAKQAVVERVSETVTSYWGKEITVYTTKKTPKVIPAKEPEVAEPTDVTEPQDSKDPLAKQEDDDSYGGPRIVCGRRRRRRKPKL